MTLSDYIQTHGYARCAKQFGVSKAAVKAWRHGHRSPRPETANRIVQLTGGEVTLAGIYAQPLPKRAA